MANPATAAGIEMDGIALTTGNDDYPIAGRHHLGIKHARLRTSQRGVGPIDLLNRLDGDGIGAESQLGAHNPDGGLGR